MRLTQERLLAILRQFADQVRELSDEYAVEAKSLAYMEMIDGIYKDSSVSGTDAQIEPSAAALVSRIDIRHGNPDVDRGPGYTVRRRDIRRPGT